MSGKPIDEAVERARQCIVMLRQHLALFVQDDVAQAMFRDADEVVATLTAAQQQGQAQGGGEVVAWQYQGRDGEWKNFVDEKHRLNTIEDGTWPIRALYAAPPSAPVGWKLVPVETDARMLDAAFMAFPRFASDTEIDQLWAAMLAAAPALAQQPAAVDGAMAVLTELVATLAATGTVTGGRIYFPERQTRELLKRACAALAAQQQGGAE